MLKTIQYCLKFKDINYFIYKLCIKLTTIDNIGILHYTKVFPFK